MSQAGALSSNGGPGTHDLYTAKWIVNPTPLAGGNQTTIQAAINAAVSGETIAIFPGTYTENLTLKAGVNLTAWGCDGSQNATGHVIINGTCTLTTAGTVSMSGIQFQTNGAAFLAVTGSAASIVNLNDCYFNMTNSTGITFSSSSSSAAINITDCKGNLGTTGIAIFSHSSAGTLTFYNVDFTNSGGSTTASTASAGRLFSRRTYFASPITTSGTNAFSTVNSQIDTAAQNVTCTTVGGSGNNTFLFMQLFSGSASAISIGSTLTVSNIIVDSTNTNAITGAGTLIYTPIAFSSSSSNINVTTQTLRNFGPSATMGSANSGNTNTLTVTNSSNTASSGANILARVGGGTAADPTHQSSVSGVTTWTWGLDNSDSDAWVLAQGTALGTNNVMRSSTAGEINYPLQPSFLAVNSATDNNVTGDGTVYTVINDTEIFDQNNDYNNATGVFTAPVTGRYQFNVSVTLNELAAAFTAGNVILVTSNRSYVLAALNVGAVRNSANTLTFGGSRLVDMDAGDTASVTVTVAGSTLTVDVFGDGSPSTSFSGFLQA